jgi:hypothetical protein
MQRLASGQAGQWLHSLLGNQAHSLRDGVLIPAPPSEPQGGGYTSQGSAVKPGSSLPSTQSTPCPATYRRATRYASRRPMTFMTSKSTGRCAESRPPAPLAEQAAHAHRDEHCSVQSVGSTTCPSRTLHSLHAPRNNFKGAPTLPRGPLRSGPPWPAGAPEWS